MPACSAERLGNSVGRGSLPSLLAAPPGYVGIALAVRAVGQPTAAGYARRPPARAFGAGLSPSAQLAHVCVCGAMMAVESRWWSGITRYANGRSAGPRDPLAIRSPRLSRHKKKGSSALIPSSLGYQLCGYRHCLSQERSTAGAVDTQPVGFRIVATAAVAAAAPPLPPPPKPPKPPP